MTVHRFYAPRSAFIDGLIALGEHETHHLRDVLRLSIDDKISVFDGEGGEYLCSIDEISKRSATLVTLKQTPPSAPESQLDLTLASAMLKGDKFDLVVKKSVELGVTRLVPLITERCDARLKDAAKKIERWQKIVIDATRQCGRATLMTVDEPTEFMVLARNHEENRLPVLFSERRGSSFDSMTPGTKITALVGPEGGWSDAELVAAHINRVSVVTLGGRILRAETASIAIAAILQHRFGDIN
ncbi:MAG: 16S rRNA (uracil(1498)-N(3))-methyltransferase [Acidobacteriota bacterium]